MYFALLAVLILEGKALADEGDAGAARYAEELVAKAHELKLAERKEWMRLGHWRKGLFGTKSEADGPDFFLASGGKTNPSEELDATLRGFFAPPSFTTGALPQHPICRFPARLAWLSEALGMDREKLRMPKCEKFEEFWKRANPQSVTLVFSSFLISNPASAFGHTFLRLNKAMEPGMTKREELLDHGVDYSARVDTSNALIYGIKGLTGLFPGTFNMYPYYYKVREYNDFESRDLWEYDLDLSRKEIVMLTAHLWELGSTWFNYYYIDENCSYHILGALEAAVPEANLIDGLRDIVVPSDTVRHLVDQKLVARIRFRPSLRHQFEARVNGMTSDELDAVERLDRDVDAALPAGFDDATKIRVLDAAIDLNDVRYAKDLVNAVDSLGARRKQRLLERRAEITLPSAPLVIDTPWEKAPHLSHGSGRFTLTTALYVPMTSVPLVESAKGSLGRARNVEMLEWRFGAGHDLTDPRPGEPDDSVVDFGLARLRFYPDKRSVKALELDELTLARILSLTPVDRFTLKPSWTVVAGSWRVRDSGCANDDCYVGGLVVGGGFAGRLAGPSLVGYAMLDLGALGSGALDGIAGSPFRGEVGPTLGLEYSAAEAVRARLRLHVGALPGQTPEWTGLAEATLRWRLARNVAIGLDGRGEPRAVSAGLAAALYY